MEPWTTARLTADLAQRMAADRWLVAREATVIEPTYRPVAERGARADLLCMRRKLTEQPMLICEVKVSRPDLMADLRTDKWRSYLKVAAVAFAAPANLGGILEIPPEAGLILRHSMAWRWARAPQFKGAPLPTPYLYRRLALTASDQAAGFGDRTPFGEPRLGAKDNVAEPTQPPIERGEARP